jgi:hypothetical protein
MPASEVEKQRQERIARNAAMLEQVMGAAQDLAATVTGEEDDQAEEDQRRQEERKERYLRAAQLAGPRKSARASTAAARLKIAAAFQGDGTVQVHAPGG